MRLEEYIAKFSLFGMSWSLLLCTGSLTAAMFYSYYHKNWEYKVYQIWW